MRLIDARVIDATHLELSQPIAPGNGEFIRIAVPDWDEDASLWQEAARKRFAEAYDEGDAIYDDL